MAIEKICKNFYRLVKFKEKKSINLHETIFVEINPEFIPNEC